MKERSEEKGRRNKRREGGNERNEEV